MYTSVILCLSINNNNNNNIYTYHVLAARRPDIVVIDKLQNVVQIVDVAVPPDCNVTMKETEKIEKYKDLSVELSSLWKMKCEVIPIVVGGLGCVTARLEMYLQKLVIISFVLWNYYNKQQF